MPDILEPILPLVPVEGIAVHVARSGLSLGDPAEARLLADGRVGVFATLRRRFLGILPNSRVGHVGHLGPVAGQILTPALLEGAVLRLRIVTLTPEHLSPTGEPEIGISVWGDPRFLIPFLEEQDPYVPPEPPAPRKGRKAAVNRSSAESEASSDAAPLPPETG